MLEIQYTSAPETDTKVLQRGIYASEANQCPRGRARLQRQIGILETDKFFIISATDLISILRSMLQRYQVLQRRINALQTDKCPPKKQCFNKKKDRVNAFWVLKFSKGRPVLRRWTSAPEINQFPGDN